MTSYVLATPMRDEIEALPDLLATLEAQTRPPALWLVFDDGSTDGSQEWLTEQARDRPWIRVESAPEAGTEYLGAHIARIKRAGLERAFALADEGGLDVGFGGVLDADIALPENHYAELLQRMSDDEGLGICSSIMVGVDEQGLETVEPFQRLDLPRGATQFFRRECWQEIGGIPPYPGFDGASNAKAKRRGWGTRLFDDIRATHKRPTATRHGVSAGYQRKGRYAYFLGHNPVLVLARGLAFSARSPHAGGVHFLGGWLGSLLRRDARCPDPELRRYYGRERPMEYLRGLFGGGPQFAESKTDRVGLLIFLAFVGAHLAVLLALGRPFIETYKLDGNVYLELAHNLWTDWSYGSVIRKDYPPVYPFVIAPLFVFGSNFLRFKALYVLHGLMVAGGSLALFPMMRSTMGPRKAWVSLGLAQLLCGVTLHALAPHTEPLFTMQILLATGATWWLVTQPSAGRALVLGLICGLAISTRRTGLVLAPAALIVVAAALWREPDRKRSLRIVGAVFAGAVLALGPEAFLALFKGVLANPYHHKVVSSHMSAVPRAAMSEGAQGLTLRILVRQPAYLLMATLGAPLLLGMSFLPRAELDRRLRLVSGFVLLTAGGLCLLSAQHILAFWLKNNMNKGYDLYPRYLDPMEPALVLVGVCVGAALLGSDVFADWRNRALALLPMGALGVWLLHRSGEIRYARGMRLPWGDAREMLGIQNPEQLFLHVGLAVMGIFGLLWMLRGVRGPIAVLVAVLLSWFLSSHHLKIWKDEGLVQRSPHAAMVLPELRQSPRSVVGVPVATRPRKRTYYQLAWRTDHDLRFFHAQELATWVDKHPQAFVLVRDEEVELSISPINSVGRYDLYRAEDLR